MTTLLRLLTDAAVDRDVPASSGNWVAAVRAMLKRLRRAPLQYVEVTASQADLAAAGVKAIFTRENDTQRIKIRDVILFGGGTNFSGGGGDRTIIITDGTTTYGTIAAALAQALATTRWGGTNFSFGAGAAPNTKSVAGQNVRLAYAGGAADYTAGSLTIGVWYELTDE